MLPTHASNRSINLQTRYDTLSSCEGKFGGIMLKTENEEAFTEIMYDDTTAKTQDVHNQTTTNTSNFKVKVKRRVFDTR